MRLRLQAGFILFAVFVVTATITEAQNAPLSQQPGQRQQMHGSTAGVKPSANISQPTAAIPAEIPQVASSLLDQPARPAQVQLDEGKLSVKADNSTLSDILHNISRKTGMTVDGLSRDQRIFGSYGPAAPREVLASLLDGLGYNVMMVGSLDNGAPRELALTPRKAGGGMNNSANHQAEIARQNMNNSSSSDDEDDNSDSPPVEQQDSVPQPPRTEPNPQDVNQPPDQQQQQQPPESPGQPGQVKTPQQMLQELQQMRQQQQQQLQQTNPQ